MAASVTKKVRLPRDSLRKLRWVAKKTGVPESEVLRRGIDREELALRRRIGADALIKMIQGSEPKKIRFRMK